MPEHLRALIVILVLAIPVFVIAKKPACAVATSGRDFARRRNLWFAITLVTFLSSDFWLCIAVIGILLLAIVPREPNKLAMFFALLFAVPAISAQIPGMGIVNHVFSIDYIRLLCLTVLLPTFLQIRTWPERARFGSLLADKILLAYLVLLFALQLDVDSLTNTLRHGVFYAFIDVFLPYYVASRAIRDPREFRDALMAFVVAAMLLAAVGAFEFARHWLLYRPLEGSLGMRWGGANYLLRAGLLRAEASTGQPIALGYVMAVAIGFFLYLRRSVPNAAAWGFGMVLLAVGLVAPVSRGPWVGAGTILLVYLATGPSAVWRLVKIGFAGLLLLPWLFVSPVGEKVVDLLPFVGTVEVHNITYRERVLSISIQQILRHPWFGSYDALFAPEMQDLRQGQGIIDIVNSYLGVGLQSGLVGLLLFCAFFAAVLFGVLRATRRLPGSDSEMHLLGRVLLATMAGILLMIFTVSSISVIPAIYWSVAGLCAAYAQSSGRAGAAGQGQVRPVVPLHV
ncbi:MAG: O-antigen ligase family protein [Burkholderiales bacterium]